MKFWHDREGYQFILAGRRFPAAMLAEHRLLAYAWGELDDLWDEETEVDHVNGVEWCNIEDNLEAIPADEHGRRTRRRAAL